MKRKLLALLLAAGMTAGLAVPAMAESLPEVTESTAEAEAPQDDLEDRVDALYEQVTDIYGTVESICNILGSVMEEASSAADAAGEAVGHITGSVELTDGQKEVVTDVTDIVDSIFKLAEDVFAETGLEDKKVEAAADTWEMIKQGINDSIYETGTDSGAEWAESVAEDWDESLFETGGVYSFPDEEFIEMEVPSSFAEMPEVTDTVEFEDMTLEEKVEYLEGSIVMFDLLQDELVSYLKENLGLGAVLDLFDVTVNQEQIAAADSSAEAVELTLEERVSALEVKIGRISSVMEVLNNVISMIS